jgi:ferredoxin
MTEDLIYCYSATGNSLFAARTIAEGLENTRLVLMPKALKGHDTRNAGKIGLVFPVIGWGLPRMVVELIETIELRPGQYVYAVATCGGTPGGTLLQLRRLLRKKGVKLAAGFVVKSPSMGGFAKEPWAVKLVRAIAGRPPREAPERFREMVRTVSEKLPHRLERSSVAANMTAGVLRAIMRKARKRFKEADRNFSVGGECTRCRTCVRICPRANVTMTDGRHAWRHDCEMCMACAAWCPTGAMRFGSWSQSGRHHPGVKAEEVLVRS